MTISIPNIGEVSVPPAADGCWNFELPYDGRAIFVYVNLESNDLTQAKFKPVSRYFADTAAFDMLARAVIAREYSTGSEDTVSSYIEHHLEVLDAPELLQCFGTSNAGAVTGGLFLSKLKLCHISLYPESAEEQAILDYTIGKEFSDCVLAVTFDRKGKPVSLDMES